ncbi:unnamed protein product [Parnassius mnemosyne]|uniref:Uncharacterized protein n=1 Tax=Parnassius mnemosyne TaxID=213953 RepID=A0AAV1KZU1_9NEOP
MEKYAFPLYPITGRKRAFCIGLSRSEARSMLDENSVPGNNWSTYPCIVKRTCSTYKEARREVKAMENVTDTKEETQHTDVIQLSEINDVLDLSHLLQDGVNIAAISTPITVTNNNAMADRITLNDVNTSFLLKADDEVVKNQGKILEILQDVQSNQIKIIQQLVMHEVLLNELW